MITLKLAKFFERNSLKGFERMSIFEYNRRIIATAR